MKCNACWQEIQGKALTTDCGHLFCVEDARRILQTEGVCPRCDTAVSRSEIHVLETNADETTAERNFIGLSPRKGELKGGRIFMTSLSCWIGQLEVGRDRATKYAEILKQQMQALHSKCQAKLQEMHGQCMKLVAQCQRHQREVETLQKENAEIKQKYTERSKQKRKLEEMYDALRQDYEAVLNGARPKQMRLEAAPMGASSLDSMPHATLQPSYHMQGRQAMQGMQGMQGMHGMQGMGMRSAQGYRLSLPAVDETPRSGGSRGHSHRSLEAMGLGGSFGRKDPPRQQSSLLRNLMESPALNQSLHHPSVNTRRGPSTDFGF